MTKLDASVFIVVWKWNNKLKKVKKKTSEIRRSATTIIIMIKT